MAAAPRFRVGVMQLTMEPLEEVLEHARVMDEARFDTIWLAEAYPWWRSTRWRRAPRRRCRRWWPARPSGSPSGWGIISPYTRHPVGRSPWRRA